MVPLLRAGNPKPKFPSLTATRIRSLSRTRSLPDDPPGSRRLVNHVLRRTVDRPPGDRNSQGAASGTPLPRVSGKERSAALGAVAEDRTPLRRPAKAQARLSEAGECKKFGARERVDRRHGVHSDSPADCRRAAVPRQRRAVNDPDRRFGGGRHAAVVDSLRGRGRLGVEAIRASSLRAYRHKLIEPVTAPIGARRSEPATGPVAYLCPPAAGTPRLTKGPDYLP